jgi:hypothetical protein
MNNRDIYSKLNLLMLFCIGFLICFGPVMAQEPDMDTKITESSKGEIDRSILSGEPSEVKVLIYVIDIDEVNSADQNFSASIYYEAQWNNPNLKHEGTNPITKSTTELWTPRLVIPSQQMAWTAFPETVQVAPDGTVTYRQKVWGHFSQPLDLRDFPMDKQTLSIHLVGVGLLEDQVKIVPLIKFGEMKSTVTDTISVPDFSLVSYTSEPKSYHAIKEKRGISGYEMKIEIARHPTYYFFKVILPLCLIVMMSWLPCWINPKEFSINIGISTTAFLTLVAYLFAMTVLLPRVSYLTRIDFFIFLSTLSVFANLIQTVVGAFLAERGKMGVIEKVNYWSRAAYPVVLVIILLVSFWM